VNSNNKITPINVDMLIKRK